MSATSVDVALSGRQFGDVDAYQTAAAATPSTSPFLNLPAELRVQIYGYLVVVGKVFFTPDRYEVRESRRRFKDWKKFAVPSLQILRTCRQIRDEAETMYLRENIFVLPFLFHRLEPFDAKWPTIYAHPTGRGRPLCSSRALKLVKKLGIPYCNRDFIPHSFAYSDWEDHEADNSTVLEEVTETERFSMAHHASLDKLYEVWNDYCDAFERMEPSYRSSRLMSRMHFVPWATVAN